MIKKHCSTLGCCRHFRNLYFKCSLYYTIYKENWGETILNIQQISSAPLKPFNEIPLLYGYNRIYYDVCQYLMIALVPLLQTVMVEFDVVWQEELMETASQAYIFSVQAQFGLDCVKGRIQETSSALHRKPSLLGLGTD